MRGDALAALVGSRICHDLISPLGAIGNGVELLELSGAPEGPELSLIGESVQSANARIRFFRIAYGIASEGTEIGRSEVAGTLASVARGGRLSYFWEVEGDQPRREVRAVFLILQCLETAMPFGGDIHVRRDGARWAVRAEADRMRVDAPLWDSLTNPRARVEVTAGQVQFAMLPEVMRELGREMTVETGETEISVGF